VQSDGKVVESGPALELLAKPRSACTRALFAAAFDIKAEAGAALDQSGAPAGTVAHEAAAARHGGSVAQQSSGELASTDPTTRIQDAAFQMSGISPKISLNSRSHLQHFQRPTPSHFCKDTPLSCGGYEHVARGSRGRLKIFETQNSRVLLSTT
jgi:hypothetical protein